jgi:DNA-binding NarL/FixJ family response regulator
MMSGKNHNRNVLIVEDLSSWRRRLKRLLKNEPVNLFEAGGYDQALKLVKKHHIDVAVIDVNLSGVPHNIDGLLLAEQMWESNSKVKIILISGSREWERRLSRFRFRPACILEKQSLDQDEFVRKVHQSVG